MKKQKNLMEMPRKLHQKIAFGLPEILFTFYTLISLLSRLSNPILLKYLGKIPTIEITFAISVFLTCIFIFISIFKKVDWYGKSENNLIFYIISYFYKNTSKKRLLSFLFILDPFLFFIYLKNGNPNGIINKIKRWTLLLLSLLSVALIWLIVGLIVNKIF